MKRFVVLSGTSRLCPAPLWKPGSHELLQNIERKNLAVATVFAAASGLFFADVQKNTDNLYGIPCLRRLGLHEFAQVTAA